MPPTQLNSSSHSPSTAPEVRHVGAGYSGRMNLFAGLIVGLVAGVAMYFATDQVFWLPIGAVMGAFVGELRVRRRR